MSRLLFQYLIQKNADLEEKYKDTEVPKPDYWWASASSPLCFCLLPCFCILSYLYLLHLSSNDQLEGDVEIQERDSVCVYRGGYIVKPFLMEFWQGQTTRLHDRIVFTKTTDGDSELGEFQHAAEGGWVYQRLAPWKGSWSCRGQGYSLIQALGSWCTSVHPRGTTGSTFLWKLDVRATDAWVQPTSVY